MKAFLSSDSLSTKNIAIHISGSKSESNRLLILKALFPNISLKNLSDSDDTQVLELGLKTLKGNVDVHHAGTAMRFLTAYFASKEGTEVILTGSSRMQERPIEILVLALQSLGADIEYLQNPGFPPLKIKGKSLIKNRVNILSNVSSQYISALMLIGPILPVGLTISMEGKNVSKPYIEMTLSLLEKIGIEARFYSNKIEIPHTKQVKSIEIVVESDWSSASYFYSLVALSKDLKFTLGSFYENSLQGDAVLPTIYKILGVETLFSASTGTISIYKKPVQLPDSLLLDLSNTPDLAQTIVVTCLGLGIGCSLSGLETLKIKETDRLLALKNELSKLGATVQIDDSSLQLEKASHILSNKIIKTYQDHRMAMAFAPLALKTNITIQDAEVVSKSYPNFWDDLKIAGISCNFDSFLD